MSLLISFINYLIIQNFLAHLSFCTELDVKHTDSILCRQFSYSMALPYYKCFYTVNKRCSVFLHA